MHSNSNPVKLVMGANIVAPGHNCGWYFYADFPQSVKSFFPFIIQYPITIYREEGQRCFMIINCKDVNNDNNCCVWW